MTRETFWATAWVTLFLPALVGTCATLLPEALPVQIAAAPVWVVWWTLSAGARLGVWAAVWGGALLETAWGVPPGACALFFLMLWGGARALGDNAPEAYTPLHGLVGGMVLAPLFALWLWVWAALWLGGASAAPLRPDLVGMVLLPATGALGGGAIFALARACDFRALWPPRQEALGDAG